MTKEIVLESVKKLMKDWQGQFEVPPVIDHLSISQSEDGFLLIDEKAVCEIDKLNADAFSFGYESLSLGLNDGDLITIEILWPFDSDPVIAKIERHHIIYKK